MYEDGHVSSCVLQEAPDIDGRKVAAGLSLVYRLQTHTVIL